MSTNWKKKKKEKKKANWIMLLLTPSLSRKKDTHIMQKALHNLAPATSIMGSMLLSCGTPRGFRSQPVFLHLYFWALCFLCCKCLFPCLYLS